MKTHRPIVAAVLFIGVGCNSNNAQPSPENSTMPSRTAFDIARCYPYIVPKDYLPYQPADGAGLGRPFGHGLFVLLVQDQDGLVQNVTPDDLTASTLSAD